MKHWFQKLRERVSDIRQRESAQRDFVRSIYSNSNRWGFDYEKPAYQRRARVVGLS